MPLGPFHIGGFEPSAFDMGAFGYEHVVGYRLLFSPSAEEYDTLKHTLIVDEVWQDRSSVSFTAKHVTSIAGGMPVKLTCNTISSLTFGGPVRGWGWRMSRASQATAYDIDLDDWQPYLDRQRVCASYDSIAIDSIVRDLVTNHATSFNASGVHSMMSEAGSLTWTPVTVAYHHDVTISQAIDSLVGMAAAPDVAHPPVWGLTPDRVVHLVGDGRSYGTTVVVDDADLSLRTFEVAEIGNSISTRAYVWGGSATVVTSLAAGGNSLRTYNTGAFWGVPDSLVYPISSLYVAVGTELIPVIQSDTPAGDGYTIVSSLNLDGNAHGGACMNSIVRAVLVQTAPASMTDVTSAITGEGGLFSSYYDYAVQGWPESPILLNSIANATHVPPGSELALLKITTTNSQVISGGRIAVSLTAAGARRGVYPIQRVRISGFDRGQTLAPIYEVEAGLTARYRVTSLL
jgi:hypothetical protein